MKGQMNTILLGVAVVLLTALLGMQLFGGDDSAKQARLNNSGNQNQQNANAGINANANNNQPAINQQNNKQNQPNPREQKANNAPKTSLEFDKMKHDFGQIQEGDVVTETFQFTNTGQEPLIISNAKGSCGCTVPKWPKKPVPPGETGEIDVKYNSSNKKGNERKTVTITANTEPKTTRLTITADVQGGGGNTAGGGNNDGIQIQQGQGS